MIKRCLISLILLILGSAPALADNVQQARQRLEKLERQIRQLQSRLNQASDKKALLHQELASTEKQIGQCLVSIRQLNLAINQQESEIDKLKQQIKKNSDALKQQQQALVQYIQTRYFSGDYQPLKWLLNQQSPAEISRISTYYRYLVESRKKLILEINANQQALNKDKEQLALAMQSKQEQKKQLNEQQQALLNDKNYRETLIESIERSIKTERNKLVDYQQNKKNLQNLLNQLVKQSQTLNKKPFAGMKRKLPLPVAVKKQNIKKMNQGLTLFCPEGSKVKAIYPGKVIFSDWLKGYGLLMIIDHGQGYMSLYAHNESLYKQKGQNVYQKEVIASVGHSGGLKENGLYFEIRHHGKTMDPLPWLKYQA